MMQTSLRRRVTWTLLVMVMIVLCSALGDAQGGPFTAQIENFWRLISTGGRTFQTLSAVNLSVSGVCTGCSPGGGGTQAQWTRGDNTTSQTMVGGTVVASAPWQWTQTWNNAGVTFGGLSATFTQTAAANLSEYLGINNDQGSLLTLQYDNASVGGGSKVACFGINNNGTAQTNSYNYAIRVAGGNQVSFASGCNQNGTRNVFANAFQAGPNITTAATASFSRLGVILSTATNTLVWSSTADINGTPDIGLARNAAGLLEVNNGTPGTFRDLLLRALQTNPTTVGALPACAAGTKGMREFVTDATLNTFHSTAVGSGANNVAVVCDGTNWYID